MPFDYESLEYRRALEAYGCEPLLAADWCGRNAGRFPNREAIVDMERSLTWEEAVERSDRLAVALSFLDLRAGDRVILLMPLGVNLFLLRAACEKAGLPYFLSAHDISERVQRAAEELKARAVITDNVERYPEFALPDVRFISVTSLWGLAEALSPGEIRSSGARLQRASPFHPLQIRASSGTTGLFPRFSHCAPCVCCFTQHIRQRRLQITGEDTIAVFGSYLGAGNGHGYYGFPMIGARILLLPRAFEIEECRASLEFALEKGATIISRTPIMDSLLPEYLPGSSVRLIFNSRPSLEPELAKKLEATSNVKIVNGYATEFGGISGNYIADSQRVRLETEGTPLDGNEVRIVSPDGSPQPAGQEGIIQVRGLHAHPGYFNRTEEDQKRWASGWFDTRDWGYLDEEGRLSLLGRLDQEGRLIRWR